MRILEENILLRGLSFHISQGRASGQTPLQNQMDSMVSGFIHQASDWKMIVAMTAGGLAYRYGKIGVTNLGVGASAKVLWRTPLRPASVVAGLGSEVTAFEFTHRTLHTITGGHAGRPLQIASRLWSWSGPGGWKESLLTSFVTFGTLKGFGRISQGQNLILQHGLQDTGMVLGHQFVSLAGIGPKPEGTLVEQFVHAEATNIQIGAGMALGHHLVPGVHGFERGLDLVLPSGGIGARKTLFPQLAMAESTASEGSHLSSPKSPLRPTILLMSSEPPRGGGDSPNALYRISAPNPLAEGLETLNKMKNLREYLLRSPTPPSFFKSRRGLRQYRALIKNLPEGHPILYEEARSLRESWGVETQTALSEKTIRSLPLYRSLIARFRTGDREAYQEARAFRETFVWFNHIHETYDLFIPKFKSSDPEFRGEIAALKNWYFTGYGSWWKMESYLLAMGLLDRGDPFIYNEARFFRETELKKNGDWRIGPVYHWLLQRFEVGSPKNWDEAIHLRNIFHHQEPKVSREAIKSYRILIPSMPQGDPLIRDEIRAIEDGLPGLASKEKKEAARILKELKKRGERRATFP